MPESGYSPPTAPAAQRSLMIKRWRTSAGPRLLVCLDPRATRQFLANDDGQIKIEPAVSPASTASSSHQGLNRECSTFNEQNPGKSNMESTASAKLNEQPNRNPFISAPSDFKFE
jgi:hypothetical protein